MAPKKDAFFLKHDLHARADEKIVALLQNHGWAGYGLYWAIVEKLYESNARIENNYALLAYDLRADAALIQSIAEDFKLFYFDEGRIANHSVDRRLAEREAKIEAGRTFGSLRKRPDGSPWVDKKATQRLASGSPMLGEERREEDITAAPRAPSAADLVREASTAARNRMIEAKLHDATLPFDFGDFKRGGRIMDLSADTIEKIVERVPRLGLDLRELLDARIRIAKAESNGRPS